MVRKVEPIKRTEPIKPIVKKALVKNITFGVLSSKDFYLGVNESRVVEYTKTIKDYAGRKLIKILKIY